MAGFFTVKVADYSFCGSKSNKKKAYHGRDRQGLHTAI